MAALYCPRCGSRRHDDLRYCATCGFDLAAVDASVGHPLPGAPDPIPRPVSDLPLVLRITEAADLLGISRSKMYELVMSGKLPGVIRIGRSVRVHRPALEPWLEDQVGPSDLR